LCKIKIFKKKNEKKNKKKEHRGIFEPLSKMIDLILHVI